MAANEDAAETAVGRGAEYHPEDREFGKQFRTPGQNAVDEAAQRDRERRRAIVKHGINRAYQELAGGNAYLGGVILQRRLRPALGIDIFEVDLAHEELADSPIPWFPEALEAFIEDPQRYLRAAPETAYGTGVPEATAARMWMTGGQTPGERARDVILRAVRSVEAMAVARGLLSARLSRSSAVMGHSLPLGVQHQPWEMDIPDPVYCVDPEKAVPVTVAVGQRGSGKSTWLAGEAMDRWVSGSKLIDIHDSKKLENAIYDLDQQQGTLKRIRREMGLPETVSDTSWSVPDIEVYVPLDASLDEQQVLYDEHGECRVTPFAIDPATIPERVFDAWIGSTTKKQRQELSRARAKLPDSGWCLRDLAVQIRDGDAQPQVKSDLIAQLERLQNSGWIRDGHSHDHLVDWREVFNDTDTVTVFSTSLMPSRRDQMRVLLYLVVALFEERNNQLYDPPRAAAVCRELHNVIPVQTNRKEDPVEKRLQKVLASEMREIASEGRHVDLELLTDTQHWGQVAARFREHVTRILLFNLQFGSAYQVFEETIGEPSFKWVRNVTEHDTGECTIIASNSRIHANPDGEQRQSWEFLQPVHAAPPPCHQIDTKREGSGWTVRARHTDETLDAPPSEWAIDLPERFTFDDFDTEEDDAKYPHVSRFIRACLTTTADDTKVPREDIHDAYNSFAATKGLDELDRQTLGTRLSSILGDDLEAGPNVKMPPSFDASEYSSKRPYAYRGVLFTKEGASHADIALDAEVVADE
jgi:hypothetical protein